MIKPIDILESLLKVRNQLIVAEQAITDGNRKYLEEYQRRSGAACDIRKKTMYLDECIAELGILIGKGEGLDKAAQLSVLGQQMIKDTNDLVKKYGS